uniref:TaqI-like C-terminal specificity domain-containing protein n=1 Tax=Turicimonas muris TaxID=1796652 RepID=UPI00402AA0A9
MKDWNIEINYGIKTGCNEAFIVNSEKRQEILSLCKNEEERKRTAELIRPILRGRDIKQYGYQWAGLYLIATFPSCNYDLTLYPALKKYLSTFAEQELRDNGYDWVADKYLASFCTQKLEQSGTTIKINGEEIQFSKKVQKSRKKTTNKWFETQDNISYWDNFSKPKLLYSDISTRLNFVYSEEHIFCNNTVYFITSDRKEELLYLQNYLNSPLMDWYYRTLSVQLGEETVRLFSIYVLEIPIPKHSGGNIYQTFALSPEEINFIESQYSQ